jgi:hypothetical protein
LIAHLVLADDLPGDDLVAPVKDHGEGLARGHLEAGGSRLRLWPLLCPLFDLIINVKNEVEE